MQEIRSEATMEEEEEGVNLEWSLPVPSVRELVRQGKPDALPPGYVRDDLHNLHSARRQWGLFLFVNHGVSNEGMRMMKENVHGFFELPNPQKQKWAQRLGSLESYRQAFVTSHDQKLEWNDMIFLKCLPSHARNLVHLFVADEKFQRREVQGQDELLPTMPGTERAMGLSPHTDNSGITMLTECGNMPGLQVLGRDGAGAPDHRAVVNKEKERLSIVTFCYPSPSLPVGPSPQLLAATGLPPLYQTLSHSEYLQRFSNRMLDDAVPFISTLKL
ncbi:Fe2OG dioxygenase domain-containing protein [Psidium guajava]|nr:Fe2OG dioxygenase domain-containing protein [Psidium guajava]